MKIFFSVKLIIKYVFFSALNKCVYIVYHRCTRREWKV